MASRKKERSETDDKMSTEEEMVKGKYTSKKNSGEESDNEGGSGSSANKKKRGRERSRTQERTKKKSMTEELLRRKAVEEKKERERKLEEEREKLEKTRSAEKRKEKDIRGSIEKIQEEVREVIEATTREVQGKLSFNRSEQGVVNKSIFKIQGEMIELLLREIDLDMENMEKQDRIKELELQSNREEKRRTEREQGQARAATKTAAKKGVKPAERTALREDSEESSGMVEVRPRRRTYAQVSASDRKDETRVEGRVVVVGKEGWRTSPTAGQTREPALVITKANEPDAKKLVNGLAKALPGVYWEAREGDNITEVGRARSEN